MNTVVWFVHEGRSIVLDGRYWTIGLVLVSDLISDAERGVRSTTKLANFVLFAHIHSSRFLSSQLNDWVTVFKLFPGFQLYIYIYCIPRTRKRKRKRKSYSMFDMWGNKEQNNRLFSHLQFSLLQEKTKRPYSKVSESCESGKSEKYFYWTLQSRLRQWMEERESERWKRVKMHSLDGQEKIKINLQLEKKRKKNRRIELGPSCPWRIVEK